MSLQRDGTFLPFDYMAYPTQIATCQNACITFGTLKSWLKLEAAGQTQGVLHEDFLCRRDKAISKLLMGRPLTVEMEGKNRQATAQTHQDVAESLADADKAMVGAAGNCTDTSTGANPELGSMSGNKCTYMPTL